MIFGAGGSGIAYLLAQFGFSNLTIVDADIVENSDVKKTMIYRKKDVGKLKTNVVSNLLTENFDTDIETCNLKPIEDAEIRSLINKYKPDFIIKACDPDMSFRYHLNKICFEYNIPFIYMAYAFEYVKVGPLFVPGKTQSDIAVELSIIKELGKKHG